MEEKEFYRRVRSIQDEVLRLNNAAMALGVYNLRKFPENFLEFSMDTAVRAERVACKLRHLIGAYGTVPPQVLMESLSQAQQIDIEQSNGMIILTIPRLLPKWKKHRSGEWLSQPLFHALETYCKQNAYPKFQKCAVCFIHSYDRALSLERIRDYDNLEVKHVLDIISAFFMADDAGYLCDIYHTTDYTDKDCTGIYIMPQDALPGFLEERKTISNSAANQLPDFGAAESP